MANVPSGVVTAEGAAGQAVVVAGRTRSSTPARGWPAGPVTRPVIVPGVWPGAGLVASNDGTWQIKNVVRVEYPQPLNNCGACHADGWVPATVDPTKGVAVTFDAGAAPWGNQLDDLLIGPTAASCMSCHQSGDPLTQFGLRVHAYGQGWAPTAFPEGRQTLIDAITTP